MTEFVVATANFGGGARAVPAAGGATDRADALAAFIGAVSGTRAIDGLPRVVALQEMTRLLKARAPSRRTDYPREIARKCGATSTYFAPAVTTAWYPLAAKWGARWADGIEEMEQGMFACTNGPARLLAPWLDSPRAGRHRGRVINLATETFYRGTRDTEPRVATAHGVRLGTLPGAQFVFLNVHLATLKEEDVGNDRLVRTDGEERSIRRPSTQGRRARSRQLRVIADFIHEVAYGSLRLPVIVAGDFNATADAPEVRAFMKAASLSSVFGSSPAQCWACGQPRPRRAAPSRYFTAKGHKEILARTPAEVAPLLGSGRDASECRISAAECCSRCQAPFFSHKRNFELIDNILYTSSDSPRIPGARTRAALKWRLGLESRPGAMGIRLDTSFSDHLPLWARFAVAPL